LVAIPGYELLEELGRGNMGVVYKARQVRADRIVALKMILAGQFAGEAERARFQTEVETIARLQHPNIVQVYEVGEHDGKPFFSLEFCPGGSLDKKLNGTPLPPAEAARLVQTLALAVQAAHERHVIHRDLKPANVLLQRGESTDYTDYTDKNNAEGNLQGQPDPDSSNLCNLRNLWINWVPKITDFGLAKKLDAVGQTASGAIMATPSYMAPEQAGGKNKEVGPAADVYALGAILYECLTGRPPFRAATTLDTILQVLYDEPVPVRQLQPKTPRDLETICHKCLEKEAGKRYDSVAELAEELRRYSAGEPIAARPVGAVERAVKWARRRPAVAAAWVLLVVALGLGVGGGGALWLWRNTEEARREAKTAQADAEEGRDALAREKRIAEGALQGKLEAEQRAQGALRGKLAAEQRAGEIAQDLITRFNHLQALRRAEQFGESGDLQQARQELLSIPAVYRRWEWFYLKSRVMDPAVVLDGHTATVRTVRFSPDGRRLASGADDNTVVVWDLASGQPAIALKGHTHQVFSVSFSPDGRRLASGSADNTVMVWDLATGRLARTLKGHKRSVMSVGFSPDGRRLASGSADDTVVVWDLATGQRARTLKGHTGSVESVSFSPDGRSLASGSVDNTVKVWDVASGQPARTFKGHTHAVNSVSFSPDGRRLASGSWDNTVVVWDVASGQPSRTLKGHTGSVESVSFSPDGRRLASGALDRTVAIWDLASGQLIRTLRGHDAWVFSVSFSADGQRLASGADDNTVVVWDLAGGQPALILNGHAAQVKSVSFSPDGRRLATGADDNTVVLWDLATGQLARTFKGHTHPVNSVSFSPDGRRLASGSWDKTVVVWDLASGQPAHTFKGRASVVTCVNFSPDGRRLASGSWDQTVVVWDLATGQRIRILKGHTHLVNSVSFSPDGRRLASGSEDKTAMVWDLVTGRLARTLKGHTRGVSCVSFSPDGRRLASGSWDRTVVVWDLPSGQRTRTLKGHTRSVESVSFNPDGRRLASGSNDNTVMVWDLATGQWAHTLKGHTAEVNSVSFSPDGRRLASGVVDGTVLVWETDGRPFWHLREAAAAEKADRWEDAAWFVAGCRQQETGLQAAEALCGFSAPQALGGLATLAGLRWREGRVELADLLERHHRACLELGRWDEAEPDFRQLRAARADTPSLWQRRAWALLSKARQQELGAAAASISGLQPFAFAPWSSLNPLWPRDADTMAFRRVCAEMDKRFPEPKDPGTASTLSRTRLLVGDGLDKAQLDRLVRLAKLAVDRKPDSVEYRATYGAALCRAGKFQAAVEQLSGPAKKQGADGSVWQQTFLALAQHRLGKLQDARDALTRAVRQMETQSKSRRPAWYERMECDFLRAEAEVTLGWRVPR
jgi:WD40 repeat protein